MSLAINNKAHKIRGKMMLENAKTEETSLEELKKERERFFEIVKIKKRHIEEHKKVLNFYQQQVAKLDKKIKELEKEQSDKK